MEVAASRPTRLLPLRIVAALLLLAIASGVVRAVADRHEVLARFPAMTQKMLATMVALSILGGVALVFLAFFRQRFGAWILAVCALGEVAIELLAGIPALYLLRVVIAAALVAWAARRAWPELRPLT